MTKFYIKPDGEFIVVYKNREFNFLYETESEENLLLVADKWQIDTINEQEKTCTLKLKEVITENN